jgi:hypothetical protein
MELILLLGKHFEGPDRVGNRLDLDAKWLQQLLDELEEFLLVVDG